MKDTELRDMTDDQIESKLKTLDPVIRQRDSKGNITEAGASALKESLPLRREAERRKAQAHKAQLDQSLADLNESLTKERVRISTMTRLFGRWS